MSSDDGKVPPQATVTAPMTVPPQTGGRGYMIRRFAGLWGFALFLLVVAWLFRGILMPFAFAVIVAYVLAPAVNRLSAIRLGKRNLPRGVAVILCYVVVLAGIVIFFMAFLPRLSGDLVRLGREAPTLWEKAQTEWTPRAARWLEKHFPSLAPQVEPRKTPPDAQSATLTELPPPPGTVVTITPMASGEYAITLPPTGLDIERVGDKRILIRPREDKPQLRLEDLIRERMVHALTSLEGEVAELLKLGQAIIIGLFAALAQLVLVFLVAAYILTDIARLHAFARSVVPERYRGEYDKIVRGIDRGLSGVVRGQMLICLLNGVLSYIGLLIFDVNYALLLAAIVAVMSLIPIFGSILSTIPIVILATFSEQGVDPVRGLAVLAWVLGVHFCESSFLGPRIMAGAARMHPVLVIFALIAGAESFGAIGAILSVPIASVIQTLFLYFRSRAWRIDAATSVMPLAQR